MLLALKSKTKLLLLTVIPLITITALVTSGLLLERKLRA